MFLKNAYSLKAANFSETYLVGQIATPDSSTQSFEMQGTRYLLEFLYVNGATNREFLSKRVKMPPRTFQCNMKILKEGGTFESKEVIDLSKFLAMRKNAHVKLRSNLI